MKRFSEQFNKQAKNIRLQSAERSELRERLVAYMEYHPLTAEAKQANTLIAEPQLSYKTVRIDLSLLSRFASAFAVLAFIVVPIYAENAIPGDVLYPVKVKFNEELRGTLTFSPYQKVAWETTRLERRISEAQLLADAGLLTPEAEAKVAEAVKVHSDAAQREIEEIGNTDSTDATIAKIALNSMLEVQTEVLEKQLAKSNANASSTPDGHSVSAIAAAIGEVKLSNNTKIDITGLPPEKLLAYLESETTRAYEYLDSVKPVASIGERNDIRRRLNDVNKKIDKAVDEESQVTDTDLLISAIYDIRKLISFMTNIDVRENLSVEDLVPKVLTDEEHLSEINSKNLQLAELDLLIEPRLEGVPEPIREKIDLNLLKVEELRGKASTSIAAKEYAQAKANLDEALAIMTDLDKQTQPFVVSTTPEKDNNRATSTKPNETPEKATTTEPAP